MYHIPLFISPFDLKAVIAVSSNGLQCFGIGLDKPSICPSFFYDTLLACSTCSFGLLFIRISSKETIAKSQSPSIVTITCGNMEGATFTLKGSHLNLNKPECVLMANKWRLPHSMKRLRISVRSLIVFVLVVFVFFLWFTVDPHVTHSHKRLNASAAEVDLRLIVIVYDRAESLKKCLDSLNHVDYLSDTVHIDVWIDRSVSGGIDDLTYVAAQSFIFDHGTYEVHAHTKHVGIYGQWIDTWHPRKDSEEIAVIIEDDVNMSPFFYRYLKAAHKKYKNYGSINGFALQGISIKHGGGTGYLSAPHGNLVFLYPILGTWAFSPKVNNWRAFVEWFHTNSPNPKFIPRVPNILPTKWYQRGMNRGGNINPKVWSMWHIYYAYLNKEVTLYKNSPDKKSFSINRKEKGLHYGTSDKSLDPIITTWNNSYINFPDKPIILNIRGKVAQNVQLAWKPN
ncbi:uncharacterized protein LOC115218871 isoform X2 [Octopus sinensis]|uniref:Uncharacterized protein LOC115218871 isoform X2 n=1 Tax=Octopus sinensis TaxID=2607531 RepID=A0A7E6FCE1_9MOLL|nr:uncharacterized protein LOC115218871 isoform X2 [Octopus sinensis]